MSDVRGRKTDDRCQKTEDRILKKAEVRKWELFEGGSRNAECGKKEFGMRKSEKGKAHGAR